VNKGNAVQQFLPNLYDFSEAPQTNLGLRRHISEISKSLKIRQTDTHTHKIEILLTSDQLAAEVCYLRNTRQKREGRIGPSTGIEPAVPTMEPLQTYTLDRPAAGIGLIGHAVVKSAEKQTFVRAASFASQACPPLFPSSLGIILDTNNYTNNRLGSQYKMK
jgi:hypothetical protein